jgi:hypothetical protein
MARTFRRHLVTFLILLFFTLLFTGFLLAAAYYFFSGSENVSLQSFSPGLPAIYLGFMAWKEWKAMVSTRKMDARKRKAAALAAARAREDSVLSDKESIG